MTAQFRDALVRLNGSPKPFNIKNTARLHGIPRKAVPAFRQHRRNGMPVEQAKAAVATMRWD